MGDPGRYRSKKKQYKRDTLLRRTAIFTVVFIICVGVFGGVAAMVMIGQNDKSAGSGSQSGAALVSAGAPPALTFLLVCDAPAAASAVSTGSAASAGGSSSASSGVSSGAGADAGDYDHAMFFLVRWDVANQKAALCALPSGAVLTSGGTSRSLAESMAYGGIPETEAMIKSGLGVSVDRYFHITAENFVTVVDELGGIIYNVPKDIPALGGSLSITAGSQNMTGLMTMELMQYTGDGAESQTETQQSILAAFVNEYMTPSTGPGSQFDFVVNACDTDYSVVDYTAEMSGFAAMGKTAVSAVSVSGTYDSVGRFTVSADGLKALTQNF